MECPHCQASHHLVVKAGFFPRKCGPTSLVQRLLCRSCKRRFSTQTTHLTYREKKPQTTLPLMRLLVSGVAQRRCAVVLGIHPITVARKLCRLGMRATRHLGEDMAQGRLGKHVVFDEMETFEHSKCKPLAIALAVEHGTRLIIGAEVASMPAKGKLAAISRKRYGKRVDDRPAALARLFSHIAKACPRLERIESDLCPRYPTAVRQHFPKAEHRRHKGRRGCVVGQGELKRGGHDPLFSLNHTCAMFRDRLKRLSRRTWCTTKRPDRLQLLVAIYAWCHNQALRGEERLVWV